MRFKRTLSMCDSCPLRDMNRVWGEGMQNPDLIIVGEAPGYHENKQGKPFVGLSGMYLEKGLSAAGLRRHRCYIMNVLACKPPDTKGKRNDITSPEAYEAMQCCKEGFFEELAFLTRSCNTILTLGETALKNILPDIEDGVMKVRGSVYDWKRVEVGPEGNVISDKMINVIPTYHPAFLGYMQKAIKTIAVFNADLRKAKRIAEGERIVYPLKNYNIYPTLPEVLTFLDRRYDRTVAIDTETTSLDPLNAELVCMGLACTESVALNIPYYKQGGEQYWDDEEWATIVAAFESFLSKNTVSFQNAAYDVRVLYHNRLIDWSILDKIKHDTMILHHVNDPELLHNIGFIGSIHADVEYHKGVMLNRKTKIIDIPDTELRPYNCDDCTIIHRTLPSMLRDLKENGLEDLYYNERMKIIKPVVMMMERGIRLDKRVLNEWVVKKEEALKKVEQELYSNLPDTFNLSSGDDLRLLLFGLVPNKCKKAKIELAARKVKIANYLAQGKVKQGNKLKQSNVHKKLEGLVQLGKLKPIYILKGYSGRKTGKKNVQKTDEESLVALRNQLNKRLEMIAQFKNQARFFKEKEQINRLIDWLIAYTERTRVYTLLKIWTKLPSFVKKDGRIHCNLNIIGTRTGRLSASEPNLLTLPKKRDKGLRKAFVPAKDYMFLSADYSGAEFVALAYVTQDPGLIEIVEKGLSIHDVNTKGVFQIDEEDKNWELYRQVMKTYQFGRIQYGGSDQEIFRKILIECPDINMTLKQFKEINVKYFKQHPVQEEWIENQQEIALKNRVVETPLGFKRRLYGSDSDIKKQAINTPIQGMIVHLINRAMIKLEDRIEEMVSKLILQIYDQLLFELWPDEEKVLKEIVREEMEKPVDIYGRAVSFKVDISTGLNFGEL